MANKVSMGNFRYLTFEGGGGHGIAYLGVVQALEEILAGNSPNQNYISPDDIDKLSAGGGANYKARFKPLIDLYQHPEKRPIKGISGSSAGAITAFMIALGINSVEMNKWMDIVTTAHVGADKHYKISLFERFFEDPDLINNRVVMKEKKVLHYFNGKTLAYVVKNLVGYGVNAILPLLNKKKPIKSTILKKILFTKKLLPGIPSAPIPGPFTNPLEAARLYYNDFTKDYLHSLLFNRGIFAGLTVRQVFEKILYVELLHEFKDKYEVARKKPGDITFSDFFFLTGVDLIITGTNITQQRPMLFSLYHTPDFPVTEALGISMCLPIVFKPVYINTKVKQVLAPGDRLDHNERYTGLWVDGGMLNNYPIHAFDNVSWINQKYQDEKDTRYLVGAHEPQAQRNFTDNVLGFRLSKSSENNLVKASQYPSSDIYPSGNNILLWSYLADLYSTSMYASTDAQIKTQLEQNHTIEINVPGTELLDFASPFVHLMRNEKPEAEAQKKAIDLSKQIILEKVTK